MSKKSKHSMIMVDFAAKDRRSVKAHLRGYDDGRVARYERFMQSQLTLDLEPDPDRVLSEAELRALAMHPSA